MTLLDALVAVTVTGTLVVLVLVLTVLVMREELLRLRRELRALRRQRRQLVRRTPSRPAPTLCEPDPALPMPYDVDAFDDSTEQAFAVLVEHLGPMPEWPGVDADPATGEATGDAR